MYTMFGKQFLCQTISEEEGGDDILTYDQKGT